MGILCLLLVASCYGYELRRSHSALHWLRALAGDDIEEACKKVDAGIPTPDPTDCHKYYVCTDKTDGTYVGPIPCPEGECFDPSATPPACTADAAAVTDIAKCNCGSDDGGACKLKCTGTLYEHIAFADDCSKHAICLTDQVDGE